MTDNRFDKDARTWDDKSHRVKLSDDIAATIIQRVSLKSDMNVLDFGCGTGLLSLRLAESVKSLTGLDNSAGMLEVFAEKAAQMGFSNVETLCLNLDEGDHLEPGYDLIISAMALHHVKNTRKVITELHQALNPGGILAIADLDPDYGRFHSDNTGVHHFGFERDEVMDQFRKAGLTKVSVTTAAEMLREGTDGVSRTFTIFLATGVKPGK
jgi:2-polyprenyl-3-methyl-5-hydroxy-6-metoxy-1,4-benzoquinol methylase